MHALSLEYILYKHKTTHQECYCGRKRILVATESANQLEWKKLGKLYVYTYVTSLRMLDSNIVILKCDDNRHQRDIRNISTTILYSLKI